PDSALQGSESLGRDFSLLGDTWQLCNIHLLRGNCFYWQADFDRAEFEYREMLRVAEQTGAPELRAKALAALSVAYANQSRPDDERSCLTALRTIAERCGYDSYKASAALSSGWLHLRLNHLEESLKDYTAALSYAYRNRDEVGLEKVLADLFPLMKRLGRPEDGRSLYSEAVARMAALKNVAGPAERIRIDSCQLNLLYKQGEIALQVGDLDQAESSLKMVLEGPLGQMSELECRTRLGLVQVCLGKKRFNDAQLLLDESLALAVSGKYEELEWQTRFFQGKLQKALGDTAAALASFNRSIDTLESMRRKIASEDIRQQFLTRRFDPYKEIVSLLCHDLHDGQKGLEFVSRAKSTTLREYLEGPTGNQTRQTEDIAQTLRALSIDYFFTADGLLAFVSGSKGNEVVELRSSGPELEQEVKKYLDSIRTGDEASFSTLSRRLYGELLEPVLRIAGNEKHESLLIFPDGPLHLLPFGGLEDARGRFLVERYALSYAPSQSVLRHCLSLGRGSAASGSRTVLLLDGTGNLPGAGNELARLSKLYGNGPRLLTAREPDVAGRLAADAEILHFAGHATVVNGKPALMLAPAPHQVVLDSRDISSWRLRKNRLVMLAGCETGIGPQAEGEIPWGLVPAFLNAGAPALIVSLLPLDDTATANLTSRFYGLLAGDSISKASALQQAQLSLLASARASGHLKPATWLPYVLIGDPR
ncbi:MAG: CHAT domain-containing protein, partial [Acidobacteriota bacterium]